MISSATLGLLVSVHGHGAGSLKKCLFSFVIKPYSYYKATRLNSDKIPRNTGIDKNREHNRGFTAVVIWEILTPLAWTRQTEFLASLVVISAIIIVYMLAWFDFCIYKCRQNMLKCK